MTTLAIDIGGTKPASKTSVALTEALSALVAPFAGRARRVAVASTGIIGHGVLTALNPDNLGGLAQFPLRETLEQLTGLPCLAVNDAQAAAWAEYHALAVDAHEMVFITISTGVGGGIVCHGQLLSGKEGLAGHIGHTLADPHGPRCGCGRIGCVEAIASGRGIAALATDDLQGMTAKTIFALAQCAVLGGSIGLAPGYIPLVERYLAQEPAVYHTPIVAAHYQHDAGLIGAALLAEDKAL